MRGYTNDRHNKYKNQTLPTNSINSPAVLNFANPGTISDPNLATGIQLARQYLRQNNKNVQPLYLGQSIGIVEMENDLLAKSIADNITGGNKLGITTTLLNLLKQCCWYQNELNSEEISISEKYVLYFRS